MYLGVAIIMYSSLLRTFSSGTDRLYHVVGKVELKKTQKTNCTIEPCGICFARRRARKVLYVVEIVLSFMFF